MLIIGAKGFAKEVLEIFHQKNETKNLCFYDDFTENSPDFLYDEFKILKSETEAKHYFESMDSHFTLGIGNPTLRFKMFQKMTKIGGVFTSVISKNAEIGSFGVKIGFGNQILSGVKISNDVQIGKGNLIYYNSIITHDVFIGDFCEISPDVKLLGRCKIGNFVKIGTGAIIFPDVEIGDQAVIAAGSVVIKNIPEKTLFAGVPAVFKKNLD